ncbi:MAG: hypothetical protein M0C28_11430 [Candidatus Moduliflexus flocculans]|nr:hypothetical protein [Candidatus Moduliflexus flocculans]
MDAITVSSVDMAEYFAADGWRDILVAFPLNILEIDGLRRLARRVKLGILVEATDGLAALAAGVARPVDVWVKIDIGANRAGLDWNDRAGSARVCCRDRPAPPAAAARPADPQRPDLQGPDPRGPPSQPRRLARQDAPGPPGPGGGGLRRARDLGRGHAVLQPARRLRRRRRGPPRQFRPLRRHPARARQLRRARCRGGGGLPGRGRPPAPARGRRLRRRHPFGERGLPLGAGRPHLRPGLPAARRRLGTGAAGDVGARPVAGARRRRDDRRCDPPDATGGHPVRPAHPLLPDRGPVGAVPGPGREHDPDHPLLRSLSRYLSKI